MKSRLIRLTTWMLTLASLLVTVVAQSDWQRKPYQEWTRSNAEKLLTDSPWAQTRSRERVDQSLLANNPFDAGAVTLRLRSALPVRQAIARLRQIRANYDRMSASEKASFDNKNKILLECPGCLENYVVVLSPPFEGPGAVPSTFQTLSLAALKSHIQLTNERGESRELLHVERPKTREGEVVLFFEKFDGKGQPLITTANKKLTVTFAARLFSDHVAIPMVFEFDVAKMVVDGAVLF